MPERLTQSVVEELCQEYFGGTVYGQMHAEMLEDEEVIRASAKWGKSVIPAYVKGFPPQFIPKVPPIAKKGVEVAVNNTMIGEVPAVKLTFPSIKKPSEEHERKRKATEDFYKALLQNIADRTTINPFKDMLTKQHGLGAAALSFPFRWDLWKELVAAREADDQTKYEELSRDFWPWDVHVTHPRNMAPDPENDPPEHYIIKDKITQRAAARLYPEEKDGMRASSGKVDRVIYCDLNQYTVIVGGQVVVDGPNPCGMIWHEWVWGGYGDLDAERNFEHLGKGIIRDAKDVIAMVVLNLNVMDAIRVTTAFTPHHVIHPEGDEMAQKVWDALRYGPLEGIATGPGVSIKPLEQNQLPPAAQWGYAEMKQLVENIFGPTIFGGNLPEQTASGMRQRVGLAETPFLAAGVAAEQATANMLRKMGRFHKEELGEERVTLLTGKRGSPLEIDPKDILLGGVIEVDFTPPTDEDRALDQERDARLQEAGRISLTEYRRRQGITDGDQQDAERALELVQFHPSMVEAVVMVARQKLLGALAPDMVGQAAETVPAGAPMGQSAVNGSEPEDGRMPTPAEAITKNARAMFTMPGA